MPLVRRGVERRVERDPNPYSDPALMTINNKSTLPLAKKNRNCRRHRLITPPAKPQS
jgi:hypothetical protein